MLSLAEATRDTRLIAKFGAIAGIALFFLFLSFRLVVFIYGIINPPVVTPPEMKFGELISNLPPQVSKPSYTYQIGTITGNLPQAPDRLRVYRVLKSDPDLLALQKAREAVRLQGYFMIETMITTNEYKWNNISGGSLIYNILNKNFEFTSGMGLEKQDFILPAEKSITSNVLKYIQDLNGSIVGIDQENVKMKYLQFNGTDLIPETDTGNAYMVQVDFQQIPVKVDPFPFTTDKTETIESLPIYYESTERTNQSFLVKAGGGRQQLQFVNGNYKNYIIDTTTHSTYPLKTSEQAFEDLQNGNAYILSTNPDSKIIIAEVKLGYFIPESSPEYIMPIFIFTGKDFVAYVHGLSKSIATDQNLSN
jgi:hypothetical protein